MKKKIFLLFSILLCSLLSGCGKNELLGTWTNSDLTSTLSFEEQGTLVVNGKYIGEYSSYEEGKLAINVDTPTLDNYYDITLAGEYMIDDGILYIIDTETLSTYRYYSEDKITTLVNSKYHSTGISTEEYFPIIISYPEDNWELYLDGTELEDVTTTEQLKNNLPAATQIIEEEILPLYQNSVINNEFVFNYLCNNAMYLWKENSYEICYEFKINCEDMIGSVCSYIICPETESIYTYNASNETISFWNGLISGSSLLRPL